jgi:hypothetical protein
VLPPCATESLTGLEADSKARKKGSCVPVLLNDSCPDGENPNEDDAEGRPVWREPRDRGSNWRGLNNSGALVGNVDEENLGGADLKASDWEPFFELSKRAEESPPGYRELKNEESSPSFRSN